jgi:hypothetical protein
MACLGEEGGKRGVLAVVGVATDSRRERGWDGGWLLEPFVTIGVGGFESA